MARSEALSGTGSAQSECDGETEVESRKDRQQAASKTFNKTVNKKKKAGGGEPPA